MQRVGTVGGRRHRYMLTLGAITGSKAVVLDRGRTCWTAGNRAWVGMRGQPGGIEDGDGGVAMQHGNANGRMRRGRQRQVADGVVA